LGEEPLAWKLPADIRRKESKEGLATGCFKRKAGPETAWPASEGLPVQQRGEKTGTRRSTDECSPCAQRGGDRGSRSHSLSPGLSREGGRHEEKREKGAQGRMWLQVRLGRQRKKGTDKKEKGETPLHFCFFKRDKHESRGKGLFCPTEGGRGLRAKNRMGRPYRRMSTTAKGRGA